MKRILKLAAVPVLMGKLNSNIRFSYTVTVTNGQATTPKYTFGVGAPAAVVDWGDGTAQSAVTSGVEMNHTYTTGGTYKVTLLMLRQDLWITGIDISSDKVVGGVTPIQYFKNLTVFSGSTNSTWVQNIASWSFPTGLVNLTLASTGVIGNISGWVLSASLQILYLNATGVTGNISGWVLPAGLQHLFMNGATVTGDISGWTIPASLVNLIINYTGLTGTPIMTSASALASFFYHGNSLTQANVDAVINAIYARRMSFTAAAPALNLSSNSAPSGIYQAANPPTTGKEKAYSLVNDNLVEGFHKWVITTA